MISAAMQLFQSSGSRSNTAKWSWLLSLGILVLTVPPGWATFLWLEPRNQRQTCAILPAAFWRGDQRLSERVCDASYGLTRSYSAANWPYKLTVNLYYLPRWFTPFRIWCHINTNTMKANGEQKTAMATVITVLTTMVKKVKQIT